MIIFSISLFLAVVVAVNYKKKIIYRFDNIPYLIRYTIFTCKWFSIKIHNGLISDDACLHDHPWSFITFIFWRGYTEESYKFPNGRLIIPDQREFEEFRLNGVNADILKPHIIKKKYSAPCILYRPANYTHRLIIDKPVWSFVITFKKKRQWGFWTPKGWAAWFSYKQENQC